MRTLGTFRMLRTDIVSPDAPILSVCGNETLLTGYCLSQGGFAFLPVWQFHPSDACLKAWKPDRLLVCRFHVLDACL